MMFRHTCYTRTSQQQHYFYHIVYGTAPYFKTYDFEIEINDCSIKKVF